MDVSSEEIIELYPNAVYFKVALKAVATCDLHVEDLNQAELKLYLPNEEIPVEKYTYQGLNLSYKPIYALGKINELTGMYEPSLNSFYLQNYALRDEIENIKVKEGYSIQYFHYDKNYEYLGSSSEIMENATYMRFVVNSNQPSSLEEMIEKSEVSMISHLDATNAYGYLNAFGTFSCQDGAIYNNRAFVFNPQGRCQVYNVKSKQEICSFQLDQVEKMVPHANSVVFGNLFYDESDSFPLLYINVYNNYSSQTDRKEGICCVYRILEENEKYSSQLVQMIKIGFVDDLSLWKSKENNKDVRPYGNFVIDTDKNQLYAYTMRDAQQQIRFFQFDVPKINEGEFSEAYGCHVVTLNKESIIDMFDIDQYAYLQGGTYHDGKIYAAMEYRGTQYGPYIYVIDLKTKMLQNLFPLKEANLTKEPEMISFHDDTLYYAQVDGVLKKFVFDTIEIHKDHEFSDWYVHTDPTYVASGVERRDCSICDYYETKEIEQLLLIGDVNRDGLVNPEDRLLLTRYLASWKEYEVDLEASDVNRDGRVNPEDRMILTRYLAKWLGYENLPYK